MGISPEGRPEQRGAGPTGDREPGEWSVGVRIQSNSRMGPAHWPRRNILKGKWTTTPCTWSISCNKHRGVTLTQSALEQLVDRLLSEAGKCVGCTGRAVADQQTSETAIT